MEVSFNINQPDGADHCRMSLSVVRVDTSNGELFRLYINNMCIEVSDVEFVSLADMLQTAVAVAKAKGVLSGTVQPVSMGRVNQ